MSAPTHRRADRQRNAGRGDGSWGENEAVYILDPDGHRIELFCNLATIDPDGVHRNADGVRMEGTHTDEL